MQLNHFIFYGQQVYCIGLSNKPPYVRKIIGSFEEPRSLPLTPIINNKNLLYILKPVQNPVPSLYGPLETSPDP